MTEGNRRRAIVTIRERPDLIATVTDWIWTAFWKRDGYAFDDILALVSASSASVGPPQCFVLLDDGEAMGTAGLIVGDLSSRPDLTPWLAALYVRPDARGRGYARDLIRAAESAAVAGGFGRLWLYTFAAEGLYLKAGWKTVERFEQNGSMATLMSRDFETLVQISN